MEDEGTPDEIPELQDEEKESEQGNDSDGDDEAEDEDMNTQDMIMMITPGREEEREKKKRKGPCKRMDEMINSLEQESTGGIKVEDINGVGSHGIMRETSKQKGI